MNKFKFPLVVFVQQELAMETQGESSMSPAIEVVFETNWPHENAIEEAQPMVHEQVEHEVEGANEEFGSDMNADQG